MAQTHGSQSFLRENLYTGLEEQVSVTSGEWMQKLSRSQASAVPCVTDTVRQAGSSRFVPDE